jgi:hypothetical protein
VKRSGRDKDVFSSKKLGNKRAEQILPRSKGERGREKWGQGRGGPRYIHRNKCKCSIIIIVIK